MVLLAPAVITIRSRAFQPLFLISSSNGAYFSIFSSIFLCENLSLVYVNSMNCIMMCGTGCIGVCYKHIVYQA